MLELDSYEILELFEKHGLIDDANDDECAEKRVTRVLEYYYKFSWDWMIDPDEFAEVGNLHPVNDKLAFVLVD